MWATNVPREARRRAPLKRAIWLAINMAAWSIVAAIYIIVLAVWYPAGSESPQNAGEALNSLRFVFVFFVTTYVVFGFFVPVLDDIERATFAVELNGLDAERKVEAARMRESWVNHPPEPAISKAWDDYYVAKRKAKAEGRQPPEPPQ